MNPEELYENYQYLAKITLYKMFPDVHNLARTKHLEVDDFMQYARMGLWQGINTFDPNKHKMKFRNFLIKNIRWSIYRNLEKEELNCSIYKDKYYKKDENKQFTLLSMSHKPFGDEEDTTFYDILPNESDSVESKVLSSVGAENLLNLINNLKKKDKELVLMKIGNKSYQEIAEHYGISRQAIHKKFERIQKKLNGYREVI